MTRRWVDEYVWCDGAIRFPQQTYTPHVLAARLVALTIQDHPWTIKTMTPDLIEIEFDIGPEGVVTWKFRPVT